MSKGLGIRLGFVGGLGVGRTGTENWVRKAKGDRDEGGNLLRDS